MESIIAEDIAERIGGQIRHWRGDPSWQIEGEAKSFGKLIFVFDGFGTPIKMTFQIYIADKEHLIKETQKALTNFSEFLRNY